MVYTLDLPDIINDRTKFKLSWIRTLNFQLKLFDTAVTLKYNRDRKWYDWVSTIIVQSVTFIIVSEKMATLKFCHIWTIGQPAVIKLWFM